MKIDEVCTLREAHDSIHELIERVAQNGSFDGADRKQMVAISKSAQRLRKLIRELVHATPRLTSVLEMPQ